MKKYVLLLGFILGFSGLTYAEDVAAPEVVNKEAVVTTEAVTTAVGTDAEAAPAQVVTAVGADAEAVAEKAVTAVGNQPAPVVDAGVAENLEFISGEVSAVDEAAKTITVKLYGETENTPGDKSITVSIDSATDITDGEKDRDLKSLTSGTEVDVEYDPASSKATYIFVY